MSSADIKDELICCICLNFYTDPVTLQCGHNFCRECIKNFLATRMKFYPYTCPQCRATLPGSPALQRNTALRNIVQHVLSQEEPNDGEVYCTFCDSTPMVASKTCMWCKVSLCNLHLTEHDKSPKHVLIQPTKSFSHVKCACHNMFLMYYCTVDAEFLCVSCCLSGKHRLHQVEFLNEAAEKEQKKLRTVQKNMIKEREMIEKSVQSLQDHLGQVPEKASDIMRRVLSMFINISIHVDQLKNHVLNEFSKQEEQVLHSVSDLIKQLELKKDNLSKKISTIEDLCQMSDPLLYLQADRYDLSTDTTGVCTNTQKETVAADLAEDLIFKTLISGMMDIMSGLQKGYYVQEASGILLDVNTASNDVYISGDLKTASWSVVNQGRPKTSSRFAARRVLSMKGFSDSKLYWDVKVSTEGGWRIGMTYPSIERKGKYSLIGSNNKSWGLRSFNKQYAVKHAGKQIPLASRPSCYKVRIYLDYTAGLLSFYELGNSMKHLYTYNTSFIEALYPVIAVWDNAWVKVLT